MQKDAKEILHYDIIPDVGLGEIHLGMTKDEILKQYNIEESINSGESKLELHTKVQGGGARLYLFDESIVLYFTKKENFILRDIAVRNQFKGKYLNQITIGTPFIELCKLKKETLRYDDEMFFPEGAYNFIVGLDIDKYQEQFGWISEYDIYSAIGTYDTSEEAKNLLSNIEIEYIFFRKDT